MDKNRKFTVTWNELESLVEGLVAEQLHKYGLLNEVWIGGSDSEAYQWNGSEDDYKQYKGDNFITELEQLINMYEEGEICSNDENDNYDIQYNIRHYKRGDNESNPEELYNQLKKIKEETDPKIVAKQKDEKQKKQEFFQELRRLIDMYEEGEIYTDDEGDDYGISQDIRHYKRGEIDFDINDLYNSLKKLHLDCLIQQWEEGDIYTDDEETQNTVNNWVKRYKNGDENFDSTQLYNWLND